MSASSSFPALYLLVLIISTSLIEDGAGNFRPTVPDSVAALQPNGWRHALVHMLAPGVGFLPSFVE